MISVSIKHIDNPGNMMVNREYSKLKVPLTLHDRDSVLRTSTALFPGTYGSSVLPDPTWTGHRFVGWCSEDLPYDAEVEYLESDGTQYIDTGLNYFPEYEIGAVVPGAVANNTLGIDQSWKLGRHSAAEPVWRASIDNVSYPTTVSCGTYADMSYHGTTFRCNSDTLTVPPNQYAEGSMVLFSTGAALPSAYPLKLYYCRLYNADGTLVRDFRPVRLGQVGYLYDKVSGQLFGNAGTGNFLYGDDTNWNANITSNTSVIPTCNHIYARWQDPSTITFDATTNGGSMGAWTGHYYYKGQPFGTLPAATHASLNFTGWYLNGNKITSTSIVPGNCTLVAQYAANSASVTIDKDWYSGSDSDWENYFGSDAYSMVSSDSCTYYFSDIAEQDYEYAMLHIDINGYSTFQFYICASSELPYDSVLVYLDQNPVESGYDWDNNGWAYSREDFESNSYNYIDGYWSEDSPCHQVTISTDGGPHTIYVVYKKDGGASDGYYIGGIAIPG